MLKPVQSVQVVPPTPVTRQVRELRPRLRSRSPAPRRGPILCFTTMNLSDRVQQFLESYLRSACSDLARRRSLGNLLNEFLIAQKSLIDRLIITLLKESKV